jgi:predicted  nucleic acid-binding Zn-ribbon protein
VDNLKKESDMVTELETSLSNYKRQVKQHEDSIQDYEDQLDSERKKLKKVIEENTGELLVPHKTFAPFFLCRTQ